MKYPVGMTFSLERGYNLHTIESVEDGIYTIYTRGISGKTHRKTIPVDVMERVIDNNLKRVYHMPTTEHFEEDLFNV